MVPKFFGLAWPSVAMTLRALSNTMWVTITEVRNVHVLVVKMRSQSYTINGK